MKRTVLLLLLATALVFALAGCGGSDEAPKTEAPAEVPEKTVIADDRIIGKWKGDDGNVEFKEDNTIVLDDGTSLPFNMPSSEELQIIGPGGTGEFTVTWEGDDRHGVASKDSTDTEITWYDRQK
jgi:predicted small lipoprotein YifL